MNNELDWVRIEIEEALTLQVPIIPIRVRRAEMPSPSEVPESVRRFCGLNGAEIEHHSWGRDLGPVLTAVDIRMYGSGARPGDSEEESAVREGPETPALEDQQDVAHEADESPQETPAGDQHRVDTDEQQTVAHDPGREVRQRAARTARSETGDASGQDPRPKAASKGIGSRVVANSEHELSENSRLSIWLMVGGGAAMMSLGLFMPWTNPKVHVSESGEGPFDYFLTGGIAWFLTVGVGLLAVVSTRRDSSLRSKPWALGLLVATGLAVTLISIQLVIGGRDSLDRGSGMYGALVWALVTALGASLNFRAHNRTG